MAQRHATCRLEALRQLLVSMQRWPPSFPSSKSRQLPAGGCDRMASCPPKCPQPDPKATSRKVTSSGTSRPTLCHLDHEKRRPPLPPNNKSKHLSSSHQNHPPQRRRKRSHQHLRRSQPPGDSIKQLPRLFSTQTTHSSRSGRIRASRVTCVKWPILFTIQSA